MITTLQCVPANLFPERRLSFKRSHIIPGVWLQRLSGKLKRVIENQTNGLPIQAQASFRATHAVLIDEDKYLGTLKNRLNSESKQLQSNDLVLLDAESIAKQVMLSLILTRRIRFMFRGIHTLSLDSTAGHKVYRPISYSHTQFYEVSPLMTFALGGKNWSTQRITKKPINEMAIKLDRYFRSGIWWTDRLGMGLKYLWNALCTTVPEEAFINLMTALEALLSTQPTEISHILAERVAVLLRTDSLSGLNVYRRVKNLYNTRSKIVHGKAFPKKGTLNSESLFITAKQSNIPRSELKSLTDTTISVINSILREPDLLKAIQTKKREDKINEDVDKFFAKRLLGN